MAELPLPINAIVPPINVTASPMYVTALSINVLNTQPTEAKAIINYSRDLVTSAKIYIEESKYSREDDNFNYKLMIFNDFCDRVDIL